MKGIVFTSLARLVEDKFGIEVWNKVLNDANVASKGIYTATNTYPDEEVVALVTALHKASDIPVPTLLNVFGQYFFGILVKKYPMFLNENMNLKEFLLSIDSVIHIEVLKLNPTASLPKFDYDASKPNFLSMFYRSPRKMCHLAEGLIQGAAEHFKETINIEHPICLHKGGDHCQLDITFKAA